MTQPPTPPAERLSREQVERFTQFPWVAEVQHLARTALALMDELSGSNSAMLAIMEDRATLRSERDRLLGERDAAVAKFEQRAVGSQMIAAVQAEAREAALVEASKLWADEDVYRMAWNVVDVAHGKTHQVPMMSILEVYHHAILRLRSSPPAPATPPAFVVPAVTTPVVVTEARLSITEKPTDAQMSVFLTLALRCASRGNDGWWREPEKVAYVLKGVLASPPSSESPHGEG